MTLSSSPTEWLVYCETHRDYLVFAGVSGTTWTSDESRIRRFPTKPMARAAAKAATWRDHRPIVWAVAATSATLDP